MIYLKLVPNEYGNAGVIMNLNQINAALTEKFQAPCRDGAKRNIIFWYDAEGDFQEVVDELELAGVKLSLSFVHKINLSELEEFSN